MVDENDWFWGNSKPDDIPENTFHFYNEKSQKIAVLDSNGLRFTPPDITSSKEAMAKGFVASLITLWEKESFVTSTFSGSIQFNISGNLVLHLTENDIKVDEPYKPSDYWTLNLARKLWKAYEKPK